ncbi:MAG: YicC family protein [Deltaproteobacteria bacterium]|nr:YicC family protein [Deltaproteobacteria bacterium]
MTGYGSGQAPLAGGNVVLELRTLNHRFVDVRVRVSRELMEHTVWLEQQIRERISRGRIDASAQIDGLGTTVPVLDVHRARAAWQAVVALRDELAPGEAVPLGLLSSVPDLFGSPLAIDAQRVRAALEQALRDGLASLDAMRAREGEALRRDLVERIDHVRTHVVAMRHGVPNVVEGYRDKLRTRIARLLEGLELPLDHARLEHEIALFADRCDVTEELTRLDSHCEQLLGLASETNVPVGRKLDFLVQEMYREANTIGSKSCDAAVAQRVVAMKSDIERIREQIQNIE